MKKFNLTGLCVPEKHYMVDLTERVSKIKTIYIDEGAYFTINRARQYGKTTLLHALEEQLGEEYIVLSISLEAADDYFKDTKIFVNGILLDICEELKRNQVDQKNLVEWQQKIEGDYPIRELSRKITSLCQQTEKKMVLIIDEVDKSADNQIFLTFLGMLRDKYLKREKGIDHTFHSVILAGVYDIKNLKLKLRPDEEKKYNSPWNIAADFDLDMSFSADDIKGMLEDYAADMNIKIDFTEISGRIYFYTNGYPYLVSWFCKWVDEQGGREWTLDNLERAEKELLSNENTLFDDLIKNIENNGELKKTVAGILLDGKDFLCARSDPAINQGLAFGILADRDHFACISNLIFETYLYNHIIAGKMREEYQLVCEREQFVVDGKLDMENVLAKFAEVMKAEYRSEDDGFIEKQGRLLFLCFLKPIINGKGNYYVEPQTRNNTRMDVVVTYGTKEYIVELKIWHGEKYRQKGLEQLKQYLESRNCDEGYMVSFNFNKRKECGVKHVEVGGRVIVEAVV